MGPVVMLTTSLQRGGAEAQVVLLARTLRERGWTVQVVSLVDGNDYPEEPGALSLGMRPGVADPRGVARLMEVLRRVRPAVVHSHLFHANLLARLVRPLFPVQRVVCTIHSLAESGRDTADMRWRDRLYRWTAPLADATVAVSKAVGARHGVELVIYNGVDTEVFRPAAERRDGRGFVWLAAGRLMWKKDFRTLLRAAERLREGEVWIAGAGPQEAELKALAGETGARVRWLGVRDDLPELMRSADALVLSSVVEGLPMVLLEAAASGLPCVGTNAGGVEEALADGDTGYVVACGDDQALAAAMTRVMEMPAAQRAGMGRRARERAVRLFDRRAAAAAWEKLYRGA